MVYEFSEPLKIRINESTYESMATVRKAYNSEFVVSLKSRNKISCTRKGSEITPSAWKLHTDWNKVNDKAKQGLSQVCFRLYE